MGGWGKSREWQEDNREEMQKEERSGQRKESNTEFLALKPKVFLDFTELYDFNDLKFTSKKYQEDLIKGRGKIYSYLHFPCNLQDLPSAVLAL